MAITLADVAKKAGVSIATASRVLTNSDYPVTKETRRRVLRAAQALDYEPNLLARSLRTDQTLTVGIIVENILSPFIPPIIRGIQDCLKEHQYLGIILNTDWDPEAEAGALRALSKRRIDGIVLVESYLRSSDKVTELANRPHVFVHRIFDSMCSNSVVPDDRYGASLAVRHLACLGHGRIAFINGPDGWDATRNRRNGFESELVAQGIPLHPSLVLSGDWGVGSGYRATQALVALGERPTAIFAANDLMALGAIYAIQGAGLRVPEDIAVVGYDDRDICGYVRPGITSVRMPCEEMGHTSAEMLLGLINGEAEAVAPVRVRGELVVRQSCGARRGAWDFEPERASLTRRISSGGA